jgi:AraC-like DNA-binding protein
LLTAKSDKESVLNGYHSGADSYLEKPFDAEILQVRMQSLLQNRQRIWSQLQTHPVKAVSDKKLNKLDREFLIRLEQIVLDNISLTEFKIEELGRQVAMSRTTLYRKVKALSGKTTIEYVRTIRINQALQLLQNNEANHFNVAEKVGFTDHEYFKKLFKKQFGYAPDEI